jgi:enamine deaminase RidA (YjgF/YER057c/UK114 family)
MTIEYRNSPTLAPPRGFAHASIAPSGRIVHVAGQVGAGPDGVVLDGLAAQTERAMRNVLEVLDAVGAGPEHLVKLTYLIVGWSEAKARDFGAGLAAAAAARPVPVVPSTLIGVHSLYRDDMLVEIEAIAMLPDET